MIPLKSLSFEQLIEIRVILMDGWSAKTAYCTTDYEGLQRDRYPKSCGQCYVTARALHHVFGWEILYNGQDGNNHYWNRLPCGLEVDFTSDQLGGDGIYPAHDMFGKPRAFKPILSCRRINPRLKLFLRQVEPALRDLKAKIEADPLMLQVTSEG